MSYQRVIDGVVDKAQSLARTSSDPKVTAQVAQTSDRYKKLCVSAKVRSAMILSYPYVLNPKVTAQVGQTSDATRNSVPVQR